MPPSLLRAWKACPFLQPPLPAGLSWVGMALSGTGQVILEAWSTKSELPTSTLDARSFLPLLSCPALAQLAVQKYEELFPAFSDSRECKLMKVSSGAGTP